jgi:methylenetetrahydrofolate dehydrogenase (NADP+)/methenyltetrahydrofolate cyclohydrolase
MTIILDGKKLSENLNDSLKNEIKLIIDQKHLAAPKLATILIGEDPASVTYTNIKRKTCAEVGIESEFIQLEKDASKSDILAEVKALNNDESVNGILLQLPLPHDLRRWTPELIETINPNKDVDGFHPYNRGKLFDYNEELVPCTPKGIIALLESYNIDIEGQHALIINRSNLVGKPLIFLLLKRNATVTVCHSYTKNLIELTRIADILIVAVGKPRFITKEMIKQGVTIIDTGTNRIEGKLCGDVDYEDVFSKCKAITPSPGGVGPMTVHFLLRNTLIAFKKQNNINSKEVEK